MATTYTTITHNGFKATIAHTNNEYKTCYIRSIIGPNGKACTKDSIYTGTGMDFRRVYGNINGTCGGYTAASNRNPEGFVCWLIDNYLVHTEDQKALIIEGWEVSRAASMAALALVDDIFY